MAESPAPTVASPAPTTPPPTVSGAATLSPAAEEVCTEECLFAFGDNAGSYLDYRCEGMTDADLGGCNLGDTVDGLENCRRCAFNEDSAGVDLLLCSMCYVLCSVLLCLCLQACHVGLFDGCEARVTLVGSCARHVFLLVVSCFK